MRSAIVLTTIIALFVISPEPAEAQRKAPKKKKAPTGVNDVTGSRAPIRDRRRTSRPASPTPATWHAPATLVRPADSMPCPEPTFDADSLRSRIVYPQSARELGIEGRVEIRVLVDEEGVPVSHRIVSSASEFLNAAAVDAVMGLHFDVSSSPGIDCSPWVTVPVDFLLSSR